MISADMSVVASGQPRPEGLLLTGDALTTLNPAKLALVRAFTRQVLGLEIQAVSADDIESIGEAPSVDKTSESTPSVAFPWESFVKIAKSNNVAAPSVPDPNMPPMTVIRLPGPREQQPLSANAIEQIGRIAAAITPYPLNADSLTERDILFLQRRANGQSTADFATEHRIRVNNITPSINKKLGVKAITAAMYRALLHGIITPPSRQVVGGTPKLSHNEYLHLYLDAIGMSAGDAGEQIGISPKTVHVNYRQPVLQKLVTSGDRDSQLAIARAFTVGIFQPL